MGLILKHRFKIVGVLAALILVTALYGKHIARSVFVFIITPSGSFEDYARPDAPDYADDEFWAALPTRDDAADHSPAGMDLDRQEIAKTDVFYVHPTTYFKRKNWNQPLDDETANDLVNTLVMPGQAAVFNGCCKVYAPRYRQATLTSFLDKNGDGEKALGLAYSDVARAFDYYMKNFNQGRPFILAGHSQGARHANRLLEEVLSTEHIEKQLVAAYTIGQPLTPLEKLPVCSSEDQTGCQISWNSQTLDAETEIGRAGAICVNPLTWTTGEEHAPASLNKGGVDFGAGGSFEEYVTDAQCDKGRLILSELNSDNFTSMPFGKGNYHRYEFGLYYMNIRKNAELRAAAFIAKAARSD